MYEYHDFDRRCMTLSIQDKFKKTEEVLTGRQQRTKRRKEQRKRRK
jgi:hypothetical protein